MPKLSCPLYKRYSCKCGYNLMIKSLPSKQLYASLSLAIRFLLRYGATVAQLAHNQYVEGSTPSSAILLGCSLVVKPLSYKQESGGSIPPGPTYAQIPERSNGVGCRPTGTCSYGGSNPSVGTLICPLSLATRTLPFQGGELGLTPKVATISGRSVTVAFAAWDREVEVRAFPSRPYADVAQLVERVFCKHQVRGFEACHRLFYFGE